MRLVVYGTKAHILQFKELSLYSEHENILQKQKATMSVNPSPLKGNKKTAAGLRVALRSR